jgi:hypothetical protein
MNEQTKHLHGLRAADNMLDLVRKLVHTGLITLGGCEIDLDNGEKHKFKAREYLELAETAIGKAIKDLKAKHQLPKVGLN